MVDEVYNRDANATKFMYLVTSKIQSTTERILFRCLHYGGTQLWWDSGARWGDCATTASNINTSGLVTQGEYITT